MEAYTEILRDQDHYDDGIVVDYATMIRMWSTLDRSMTAFNRKCGFITLRPSKDGVEGVSVKKRSSE
jgi:hypothetical protein